MNNLVGKTIKLNLAGLDGNAFNLLAAFARQATKEEWTQAEISIVHNECMSGDYDHLLITLLAHCKSPDSSSSGDDLTDEEYERQVESGRCVDCGRLVLSCVCD